MGRIFLNHPGGITLYSCANCDTALTNRSELTSMVRTRLINTGFLAFTLGWFLHRSNRNWRKTGILRFNMSFLNFVLFWRSTAQITHVWSRFLRQIENSVSFKCELSPTISYPVNDTKVLLIIPFRLVFTMIFPKLLSIMLRLWKFFGFRNDWNWKFTLCYFQLLKCQFRQIILTGNNISD